jgi:2,3-bisphosphoglycerate-independent phosphoglycerate mutase
LDKFQELGYGKLGTVIGRYYAMDRDKRWERTKIAFQALTKGEGQKGEDPIKDVKAKYDKDENDEFLKPIVYNRPEADIRGDSYLGHN